MPFDTVTVPDLRVVFGLVAAAAFCFAMALPWLLELSSRPAPEADDPLGLDEKRAERIRSRL